MTLEEIAVHLLTGDQLEISKALKIDKSTVSRALNPQERYKNPKVEEYAILIIKDRLKRQKQAK